MKKYDVVAIGELNVDYVMKVPELKLIPGTEIICEEALLTLGSSPAITACVAASLGVNVAFCGKLASDFYGEVCRDTLFRYGVDDVFIIPQKGKTGITVSISDPKERFLCTFEGDTINSLRVKDLPLSLFQSCRHIHVGSYYMNEKLAEDLPRVFYAAHENNITTSLDTGWDPHEKDASLLYETLKYTNIFFPNKKETCAIGTDNDYETAVQNILRGMSPNAILAVKCGREGCRVYYDNQHLFCPAFQAEAVDTTGAGDSFDAGFLVAWLQGQRIDYCAAFACATAAVSVTKLGGTICCPTKTQVSLLMNGNKSF